MKGAVKRTSGGYITPAYPPTVGPNDNPTREQLAVMLWRYAGSPAATEKELHFTDSDKISRYALDAMRWAVENEIINGYEDGQLGLICKDVEYTMKRGMSFTTPATATPVPGMGVAPYRYLENV